MVFSKAVEYAVKSLVYMAKQPDREFFGVQEISEKLNVSRPYLAKILQNLVRGGLLKSTTGPGGGFGFEKAPNRIKVMDLVNEFGDDAAFEACFFGWGECKDQNPCPMHDTWKDFKTELRVQMKSMNIIEAAERSWSQWD